MLEFVHDLLIINQASPVLPSWVQSMIIGGFAAWAAVSRTAADVTIRRFDYTFGVIAMLLIAVLIGLVQTANMIYVESRLWVAANILHSISLFAVSYALTKLAVARANDSGNHDRMLYLIGFFPFLSFAYVMRPSLTKVKSAGLRKTAWKGYIYAALLLLPLVAVSAVQDHVKSIAVADPELKHRVDHRTSQAYIRVYGVSKYLDTVISSIQENGGDAELLSDRIKVVMGDAAGPEYFTEAAFPGIASAICEHPTWGPYLKSDSAFPIEFHGSGAAAGKSLRVVSDICE